MSHLIIFRSTWGWGLYYTISLNPKPWDHKIIWLSLGYFHALVFGLGGFQGLWDYSGSRAGGSRDSVGM